VSRNKYVNLFDFSPIPYFALDQQGVIKEVNLSAGRMLGIERKKLIDKRFITFISLDERDVFNGFIESVFKSTVKHSCELKVMNKDKRIFYVRLEGLKFEDTLENNQSCQVALIDLTEYKKVEESLKESSHKLEGLNATKDKFFSIIAHDLRSPFQAALGFSELLTMDLENLSHEEIKSFGSKLNESLINLLGLIENLLQWSLMQRNMLDYRCVKIDLYDFVEKVVEISNQSAMKKGISIFNKTSTKTKVSADVDMLRSVVQNLILNAIKFTQKSGKIIISSVERGDMVEVSIEDNGIGIEPARTYELFNFTSMLSTNGTEGEKGTGLGLPLCKEFIEKNGGKIWVKSELGKGSKFTFTVTKH
jgi:PAS domain S-box-containing protein